eukprot:TRINITY_DN48419_c0_g1_i1.p1 TRINITY_DN48419_c0_g1~~TRINITY_DN48419_c0_g1_i1.p1  ORF type:complete len:550 (-),score=54.91 TRINITY_DN48419_c0_g1_i1:636-2261(-)
MEEVFKVSDVLGVIVEYNDIRTIVMLTQVSTQLRRFFLDVLEHRELWFVLVGLEYSVGKFTVFGKPKVLEDVPCPYSHRRIPGGKARYTTNPVEQHKFREEQLMMFFERLTRDNTIPPPGTPLLVGCHNVHLLAPATDFAKTLDCEIAGVWGIAAHTNIAVSVRRLFGAFYNELYPNPDTLTGQSSTMKQALKRLNHKPLADFEAFSTRAQTLIDFGHQHPHPVEYHITRLDHVTADTWTTLQRPVCVEAPPKYPCVMPSQWPSWHLDTVKDTETFKYLFRPEEHPSVSPHAADAPADILTRPVEPESTDLDDEQVDGHPIPIDVSFGEKLLLHHLGASRLVSIGVEEHTGKDVKVPLEDLLEHLHHSTDVNAVYCVDTEVLIQPEVKAKGVFWPLSTGFPANPLRVVEDAQLTEEQLQTLGNLRHRLFLLVGGSLSGSELHQEPDNSFVYTSLLSGLKIWVLFAPTVEAKLPQTVEECMNLIEARQLPENVECVVCTQKPGEVVIVPPGWWHAVVNVGPTVAVAENYVEPGHVKLGTFGP